MTEPKRASVCIVGAGSMGIITGYHLGLGGAAVTFLVRPHRVAQLSRPQLIYSYDDNTLKSFSDFKLLTDPAELSGTSFDYIVITLDGDALRAEAGQRLTTAIGSVARGTTTGVVLGSMGVDLRTWFLEHSSLPETQVTNAVLGIYAYEAQALTMPERQGIKTDLLAKADYAYSHPGPHGFTVDLSAPAVAKGFTALYNKNGISQCATISADQYRAQTGFFAVLMAMHLMDWPAAAQIDHEDERWQLGIASMREIHQLTICRPTEGPAGEPVDAAGMLAFFRQIESDAAPLDAATFNRYHHGGKVNGQDLGILREALRRGEAEGAEMPALAALIDRLSQKRPDA